MARTTTLSDEEILRRALSKHAPRKSGGGRAMSFIRSKVSTRQIATMGVLVTMGVTAVCFVVVAT